MKSINFFDHIFTLTESRLNSLHNQTKILVDASLEESTFNMTDGEKAKKEKYARILKHKRGKYFQEKYGKDADKVLYAVATKLALKDDINKENDAIIETDNCSNCGYDLDPISETAKYLDSLL